MNYVLPFFSISSFTMAGLLIIFSTGAEASIGVNYGTLANNLPPPHQVAEFLLHSTVINRIRLFDTDPHILQAFANTGIAITVTVPNDQIPHLTNLSSAKQWISDQIQPHFPSTNIIRILVGNEVISTANHLLIRTLIPAMQSLHTALVSASLHRRIQISTPHSLGILTNTTPPSSAKFRRGYDTNVLKPLLSFLLRSTSSPFVVNPYPFFGYSIETLDFALFRPNPGLFDQHTKLLYTNMLDAQLDSVYSAMDKLGFSDVEIVIGEIGWPSEGDIDQIGVDVATAAEFNKNLVTRVNSGTGTPLMPNRTFETYIFALFNENLKSGPTSERNFGIFRSDLSPIYDIGIFRPTFRSSNPENNPATPVRASPEKRWCVTKAGAETVALQRNIDYVCGLGLDCRPINEGGLCFLPNTVKAHSEYAMNLYYQTMEKHEFDCDFDNTGEITTIDPSYGNCEYQA